MDTIKPLFTATATASGGRNGHTESDDCMVKADLSVPKAMGGPGKPGHRHAGAPVRRRLRGLLRRRARLRRQAAQEGRRVGQGDAVTIGPRDGAASAWRSVRVEDRSLPQAELQALAKEAHEKICPYSHATRGNVPVEFEVVGG